VPPLAVDIDQEDDLLEGEEERDAERQDGADDAISLCVSTARLARKKFDILEIAEAAEIEGMPSTRTGRPQARPEAATWRSDG
jgi:hypothetical protein